MIALALVALALGIAALLLGVWLGRRRAVLAPRHTGHVRSLVPLPTKRCASRARTALTHPPQPTELMCPACGEFFLKQAWQAGVLCKPCANERDAIDAKAAMEREAAWLNGTQPLTPEWERRLTPKRHVP